MKEKKERKRWGLILFIVLIMVGTSFSVFLYGVSPQSDVVKYNGIKFASSPSQGNVWIAKISGREAAFSFLPQEVENVNMSRGINERLQGKFEIDATYDFNSTYKESIALAQHQMGLTLGAYNIYLRRGFTENNTFNLPIITCNNSTANVPVIYFKQGNSTKIYLDNDCIVAEALTGADFIKSKDKILYSVLGVLK